MSTSISATARSYPKLPYEAMANAVLGASYTLSVAFVGRTRAQSFNASYRNKTYVPDVLSFPLASDTGEIIMCPQVIKADAKRSGVRYRDHFAFLFIHGCIHLKGYDHGATMSKLERRFCAQFGVTPTTTSNE